LKWDFSRTQCFWERTNIFWNLIWWYIIKLTHWSWRWFVEIYSGYGGQWTINWRRSWRGCIHWFQSYIVFALLWKEYICILVNNVCRLLNQTFRFHSTNEWKFRKSIFEEILSALVLSESNGVGS
jgi:hypothetical protein